MNNVHQGPVCTSFIKYTDTFSFELKRIGIDAILPVVHTNESALNPETLDVEI